MHELVMFEWNKKLHSLFQDSDQKEGEQYSKKYRLMCYFVATNIHLHSDEVVSDDDMTIEEFEQRNKKVLQHIFELGKEHFQYELSNNQMRKGIFLYLQGEYGSQSINN